MVPQTDSGEGGDTTGVVTGLGHLFLPTVWKRLGFAEAPCLEVLGGVMRLVPTGPTR